jgi:DNA-binding response OmpR family regulator
MAEPLPAWIAFVDGGPAIAMAAHHLGLPVELVRDARAFRDRLEHGRPRLVVVASPPASPRDVDHLLDLRRRRAGLRILHLSAPDAVDARVAALRGGFDEALPTTISPDELIARLTLLDERAQRGPARSMVPVADGVVLDPIAHEVRRDGTLVHLRPKEFQLLATLAGHPGRAYTRRQLLDRVWGPGHDGDPRTVDVHVRWLRAKIEPRPEAPVHLVTVRGVGYRLDPQPR